MNKREKEVIQAQLDAEKIVLKKLETQYQKALSDINQKVKLFDADIKSLDVLLNMDGLDDDRKATLESMKQAKIYQKQYQQALQKQVAGILDKLHGDTYATVEQYLKECYQDGYLGTMYDIQGQGIPVVVPIDQEAATKAVVLDSKVVEGYYNALGVDFDRLKKVIPAEVSRGIASSLPYIDIARNINNASRSGLYNAYRIARTEGHRIQQTATHDAQKAAKAKGADVVKQWDSTLDGRTRPTHRKLDGQIREVDEPFEVGGKKTMMPGGFGRPEEDINCRCVSLTRARWALDEDELETLKERAAFFELDKTKDFDDFKRKYLKSAEEIKQNEDRQAEIRARREAYKKREAAKKKNAPALNVYGKEILFDEKTDSERWKNAKRIINDLATEYDTRLVKVRPGSVKSAGTFNTAGEMLLSSVKPETVYHEFAHSIASEQYTKLKIADDSSFWKEIKSIKRAYRKDVADEPRRWISVYEHSMNNNDEFLAEAFTYAKMLEKGLELPEHYGNDATYPLKVLAIVDKYFKKK